MNTHHPHEREAILNAMATDPPPPYIVTPPANAEGPDATMWTLQRGSTAEGVEPAYVWLVYVAPDGRHLSGGRTLKHPPTPVVPLDPELAD